MIELGDRAGFLLESTACLEVLRGKAWKNLQRHDVIEAGVECSIDFAQSARPKRRQNLVKAKLEAGLEIRDSRGQRKDSGRSRRETGRLLEKTAGAIVRGQQRFDLAANRRIVTRRGQEPRAFPLWKPDGISKQLLQALPGFNHYWDEPDAGILSRRS